MARWEEAMQTIFDSKTLPAAKRRQAWQDAICEIYLRVDCAAESQSSYDGFVREIRFGEVTLTDTLSSPQSVLRQSRHIAQLEKDCYYMGLAQSGNINIRQAKSSMTMHAGVGALFDANEPYELRCDTKLRSFWVELPRQAFASRFASERPPLTAHLNLSRGLGRIAVEFCSALALEGANLDPQSRARLGEQFMDILALAISAEPDRRPPAEACVQSGRLLLVRNYIDEHLSDPNLSLGDIAKKNGISLRTLHQLFHPMGMSASEWLRTRRLQRSYDLLSSPQHETKSITEIAYSIGFNSSSHFSNLFRTQFGLRPSDVRKTSAASGLS
ncbi:MAG: helix-turn-helix domain-containing protein [Roseiarcus sp.]|uniref:helix-turn-helix domain-containing protein n=1 Tax=Roseiarcus sp. TaxID=1969460 RepID=UPI003C238992